MLEIMEEKDGNKACLCCRNCGGRVGQAEYVLCKRMGTTVSKQYLLLEGKEILAHTVEKFEKSKMIDEIILVVGQEDVSRMKQMAAGYGWKKISAVAQGGAERQDSIWNGRVRIQSLSFPRKHTGKSSHTPARTCRCILPNG